MFVTSQFNCINCAEYAVPNKKGVVCALNRLITFSCRNSLKTRRLAGSIACHNRGIVEAAATAGRAASRTTSSSTAARCSCRTGRIGSARPKVAASGTAGSSGDTPTPGSTATAAAPRTTSATIGDSGCQNRPGRQWNIRSVMPRSVGPQLAFLRLLGRPPGRTTGPQNRAEPGVAGFVGALAEQSQAVSARATEGRVLRWADGLGQSRAGRARRGRRPHGPARPCSVILLGVVPTLPATPSEPQIPPRQRQSSRVSARTARRPFATVAVILACSAAARPEDGYALWLRYAPPASRAKPPRASSGANRPTLSAARDEARPSGSSLNGFTASHPTPRASARPASGSSPDPRRSPGPSPSGRRPPRCAR